MKKMLPILCLLIAPVCLSGAESKLSLEEGFRSPPMEARPWVRWAWMNANVSKEGIRSDLEAFKRAGLAGAHIFNLDYGLPQGPVAFNSPEWFEMMCYAMQEADRLGLQLGMHNSAGWSTSGGPWVRPEDSMQVVVSTETRVKGPAKFDAVLPVSKSYIGADDYRDVAVMAYPTPADEMVTMGAASPKFAITQGKGARTPVLDGDLLKSFAFPAQEGSAPRYLQIEFEKPFTVRQLVLTPAKKEAGFKGVLEISNDGKKFTEVRVVDLMRQADRQEYPYRQFITFPKVSARIFRISVTNAKGGPAKPIEILEAGLSGRLTVHDLPGKTLEQRHFFQTKPVDAKSRPFEEGAVRMSDIVEITEKMDATGRLVWDVPAGNWTILRVGHQSNGMRNHPFHLGVNVPKDSHPAGEGLECDKLSKEAFEAHWNESVGKLIRQLGPLTGKSFTKIEVDSWEVGSQNWTPKMRGEFQKRRGYDMTRFLPVFAGQTVDNIETTERFLWDFRRTLADMLADNYAGHMTKLANQNGLEVAIENYGTGPFDDLQYGGRVDIPVGVAWVQNGSPQGCTMLAASAAHTYGKKIVGSETFTAGESGGNRWDTDPYALKRLGDLLYCTGVNRFIFHAATLQRWPDRKPGLTYGKVGTQFSTSVTWWDNGGTAWFSYLSRCQWLLQQGLPVADVLVLAGESVPPPTYYGNQFPDVSTGYDYDICSQEAFLTRVQFRDGRLVMPDGMSYRALMLPKDFAMPETVMRKVKQLAEAGATIVGAKPTRATGYFGYPKNDEEVRATVQKLWSTSLNKNGSGVTLGNAKVALDALKLPPDFEVLGERHQVIYKHRATSGAEIYFVSNQKYFADEFEAAFRVTGKIPELWNPETGAIEKAPLYREENGRTIVPLRLESSGSVFVVFREKSDGRQLVAVKKLSGQNPQTLQILKANYGYFDKKNHPRIADISNSKAASYKRILTPERFVEKDPAPGVRKHMLAIYSVDEKLHSQAARDDSVLEMPQLPERFKSVRILYGELNADAAGTDAVVNVTDKLNALVRDGTLSVAVNKDLADKSPLPSKPKELRVEYLYNGRWNIAIMPEGQRLELPGAYEANVPQATCDLSVKSDNRIELRAWTAGSYEFTSANGKTLRAQIDKVPPPQEITGSWELNFPPKLGAPARATFDKLISWTESKDDGIKYFSGTATYKKEIEIPAGQVAADATLYLDLGEVKNIAQIFVNGKDTGILWKPPFRANITAAARAGKNTVEIKVTNLWPNRLIGDENLPSDRDWQWNRNLTDWPKWVTEGKPSPNGQVAFVSARHWFKDSPLIPSGILGPVRLLSTKNIVLPEN